MRKIQIITLIISSLVLFSSCTKDELLQINESFYLRHAGADMPVHVHGNFEERILLVTLHGAGSFGLSFRDSAFTSILEEEYAIVYWDQRGQGSSQGSYPAPEDIVDTMSKDIFALVMVLREKYGESTSIYLMGHSFGGLLGMDALIYHNLQQFVSGWISVSGAFNFDDVQIARWATMRAVADEQLGLGNSIDEWAGIKNDLFELDPENDDDYDAILSFVPQANSLLINDGIVVQPSLSWQRFYNSAMVSNPLRWFFSHMFNQPVNQAIEDEASLSNELDQITIPSLWIYGKYDFSVPYLIGAQGFENIGSDFKDFYLFEESLHHPYDTEPGYFAERVYSFINSVENN